MRDWTRAVVFGWAGSGSREVATGAIPSGDPIAKGMVLGLAALEQPMGFLPWRMPSHPSVRHYDRSELMRLTNLRCRGAVWARAPFGTSGPAAGASARGAAIRVRAKSGSDDREIRAWGAARRSTQTITAPNGAPGPSRASAYPTTRRGNACGLFYCAQT